MSGIPIRPGDARSPFVPEWIFEHAGRQPERMALASPRSRVTWGQLALRIRRLARILETRGIGPEDHVFSAVAASPGAVIASLAVQLRGAVSVEIARGVGPSVHRQVLERTRPVAAFVHAADVAALSPLFEEFDVGHVFVVSDEPPTSGTWKLLQHRSAGVLADDGRVEEVFLQRWSGALQVLRVGAADARNGSPTAVDRDVDRPALVLFTSGSTGAPTGVVLTHRNLANARQIACALDLRGTDRAMLVLPLSYSYGRSVVHSHLLCGASVYLDPRFLYPRLVVETMAREQTTTFAGVPLTYELLRRHVDLKELRLPSLRQLTQAGGAMSPEARSWVRRAFPDAGFFVMYGATEATARLTVLPPSEGVRKDGSIGLPIPGVTLRIVDEGGADVPRGTVGHLIAHGDNISPGYLDDPARTAETFRDGWLWTGDLAHQDEEGFTFLVGRAREMMKIGGRRASPRTVEDVVLQHPSVADCVAAGVPDPLTGEACGLAVVLRDGRSLDDDTLRRFCHARLPSWLVPRVLLRLDRLPRNENGKVLRSHVAEQLQSAVATRASQGDGRFGAGDDAGNSERTDDRNGDRIDGRNGDRDDDQDDDRGHNRIEQRARENEDVRECGASESLPVPVVRIAAGNGSPDASMTSSRQQTGEHT